MGILGIYYSSVKKEKKMDKMNLSNAVAPYLEELYRQAPLYGTIGVDIVLHAGRITKVEKRVSVNVKPGAEEEVNK
jgi:hypothetical protein